MLDIEKAFSLDNHQIFLLAEQAMPEELLEDAYMLFWDALEKKKYRVATFLMHKPYFSPLKGSMPTNWVTLICRFPDLLQVACEKHIVQDRIETKNAIVLIKSALKIKFINKKGVKNFITQFTYESLSKQEKHQCYDLLGKLLCENEWYWAREFIEWGVPIEKNAIRIWATKGFSLPSKGESKQKFVWPHNEIRQYKKKILLAIYQLGEDLADGFVKNNRVTALLFVLKILSKDKKKKRNLLLKSIKSCLDNPNSEVSDYLARALPSVVLSAYTPSDIWAKKCIQKNVSLSEIERLIIDNKRRDIQKYALEESGLKNTQEPTLFLKSLKEKPKHIATLAINEKVQQLGAEALIPEITRKEHLDMLLSGGHDPFSLMTLVWKPRHQEYLMNRLAEL